MTSQPFTINGYTLYYREATNTIHSASGHEMYKGSVKQFKLDESVQSILDSFGFKGSAITSVKDLVSVAK